MRNLFAFLMGTMAAALGLTACQPAPEQARYTVEDYRQDDASRRETLARCANDPGTLDKTPDCINAKRASRLEDSKRLRELPPVKLPDR